MRMFCGQCWRKWNSIPRVLTFEKCYIASEPGFLWFGNLCGLKIFTQAGNMLCRVNGKQKSDKSQDKTAVEDIEIESVPFSSRVAFLTHHLKLIQGLYSFQHGDICWLTPSLHRCPVVCSLAHVVLISHCLLAPDDPHSPRTIPNKGGEASLPLIVYYSHQGREVIPKQMHFHVRMWMGPGSSCSLSECAGRGLFWVQRSDVIMHPSTNDIEYVHLTSIFPLLVPTVLGREHSHGIWVEALRRSFLEYHRQGMAVVTGQLQGRGRLYEASWVGEWENTCDCNNPGFQALTAYSIVSLDFCYGT